MAVNQLESGLFVDSTFTKAKRQPATGPAYGDWAKPKEEYDWRRQMANGGLLQFDLSRLGLADFRAMREHYQINISLAILTFTMHQLDWSIEHPDPKVVSFLEENLSETWTRMVRGVSQAFWAGYSPMALEYRNDPISGKLRVTKFKDLIPEEVDVNWKTVKGASPRGFPRPDRFVFDGMHQNVGRRSGTTSRSNRNRKNVIPVENSFWYPVLMENGDMRGRKLLRPAFPAWFFSQIMHLYANRYFERFGEPVIIGRAPLDDEVVVGQQNGQTVTKSGKEVMENIVANIRNSSAVVLPSDRTPNGRGDQHDFEYVVEYLEAQMRGADFERYMARLDEEMSLAMFAPVLLFRTSDVGSYNLGQAHEKLFFMMMNGLIADMAEYLERFVLNRLIDFNFSPNSPRCRFRWRQLNKDKDETVRAMAQSVISSGLMKPDAEELGIAVGMSFNEIPQLIAPEVGPGTSTPDPNNDKSRFSTADEIVARIRDQARKHWGEDDFIPSLGYRKKMELSIGSDSGLAEAACHSRAEKVYSSVEAWMPEAIQSSEGPDHFADKVDLILRRELQ